MRHSNVKRKFGREKNQRVALMKSLACNLIIRGKILTTEPKAKEIRPYAEKLVTTAKPGTIASRRLLRAKIGDPKAVKKLVEVLAPKYKERTGGYLRITKIPARQGDGSAMATVEFV
jgi:large subunit ribosomal protein L17